MNILLINHYAGSTHHGMEYRPFYLSREWVRSGHNVTILAGSFSHIRTRQPEIPGDQKSITQEIDGVTYNWYRTPSYEGNGLGRVISIFSFLWTLFRSGKKTARDFKPDVVIASSTYPMDIWPARRIAKYAGAQLVYEVHDLWPLSPIEIGGMSRWHPFIIWCQLAEDYAYRHVDKVVSMLPKTQSYMESRGMLPEKFYYVPNGIDMGEWEDVQPLSDDVSVKLEQLRKYGRPLVGYAGTHGLANALDDLLDVAKLAENEFEVVLVGKGPERDRLLKRVRDEAIGNVTMLPAIPKSSVPAFLKEIDIAYIGWHNNPLYRFGISPNKLLDYMMAARPIVHSVNAGNDPVAEAGCGITVPPGDVSAICEAIKKIVNMSTEDRQEMGENGRRFVLAEQTYAVLAQRFIQVLEK